MSFLLGETIMYLLKLLSASCFALLITACGGGGGSDAPSSSSSTPPSTSSRSISGSVEGTIIIAHGLDGTPFATASTAGQMPNSNNYFDFTLVDLPANVPIMISLIEDGQIFPMYFDGDSTNVLSLTDVETSLQLGLVATANNGRATPANNPLQNAGVSRNPENTNFPDLSPVTSGLSLEDAISKGEGALSNGWIAGADIYFEIAIILAGTSTSTEADHARFMYALTQVVSWATQTSSDGNSADMDRVGDILDRVGVQKGEARINPNLGQLPYPLPEDSPTTGDYQNFLREIPRDNILKAIAQLEQISENFEAFAFSPFSSPLVDERMEADYGDVLILTATLKMLVGIVDFQYAYNLNVDVDVEQAANPSIETVLVKYPEFLGLKNGTGSSSLASSKELIESALNDLKKGITAIGLEGDQQHDDFITIEPTERADALNWVNEAQVAFANGTYSDANGNIVSIMKIFEGVDFRQPHLLPIFRGDEPSGPFPDTTFGGAVSDTGLNKDEYPNYPWGDGIPDVLQDDECLILNVCY